MGHRFDSWLGAIPHATEQLSLCALESVLRKRSHCDKKPVYQKEEQPPATREGPLGSKAPLRQGKVPSGAKPPCNKGRSP